MFASVSTGKRCGMCVTYINECDFDGFAPTACAYMDGAVVQEETFQTSSDTECENYVTATSGDTTSSDMARCDTGIPDVAKQLALYALEQGGVEKPVTKYSVARAIKDNMIDGQLQKRVCGSFKASSIGKELCDKLAVTTTVDLISNYLIGIDTDDMVDAAIDLVPDKVANKFGSFIHKVGLKIFSKASGDARNADKCDAAELAKHLYLSAFFILCLSLVMII